MNYTLEDLQQLHSNKRSAEEKAQVDKEAYKAGKRGYPTASPESLSEATTERYMTCYQMGYNTAQWENNHAN